MNKIGIYDPYFHILGGGEKYVLAIASCLESQGNQITICLDKPEYLVKAALKFGFKTNLFKTTVWGKNRNERDSLLKNFDTVYYVTDGSLFFSSAKKNILIIQSPVHIPKKTLVNLLKLNNWRVVCYSHFIADIIKNRLNIKADTLFVPIEKPSPAQSYKKNLIISVGRFFPHLHNKKQKEMVYMFQKLVDEGLTDTHLLLVGSVDPGGEEYYNGVKSIIGKYPIKIITNATYEELNRLYGYAKIYWHCAGYGENLILFPERAEHFGVSTLEAMSHYVVPVVFAGGGQLEIIDNGATGFLWKAEAELGKYTRELLRNESMRDRIAQKAFRSAMNYNLENFCDQLNEILEK